MRAAADWLALAPDARTPGLVGTSDATPLTQREREIAVLAAQQLPAADIAAQLHLSRRTVENHLQRIYTKLGISSRSELADVLDPG
jgi:DNA-binding CsgD family transcriptional regulator